MDMLNPRIAFESLQGFLETGGVVLVWIMALAFVLWTVILERVVYWSSAHKPRANAAVNEWVRWKRDHGGWQDDPWRRWEGMALRDRLISEVKEGAQQNVELVKTLVAIAPLLGLLGTVTGMVEVFDVMSITGSSNARSMSAGVSKATIPTMAGMVVSLSGLALSNQFERSAKNQVQELADRMTLD